jgi:hypothetical protein
MKPLVGWDFLKNGLGILINLQLLKKGENSDSFYKDINIVGSYLQISKFW